MRRRLFALSKARSSLLSIDQQLNRAPTMAQQQQQQHPTTLASLPDDCLVECLKHLTLEER